MLAFPVVINLHFCIRTGSRVNNSLQLLFLHHFKLVPTLGLLHLSTLPGQLFSKIFWQNILIHHRQTSLSQRGLLRTPYLKQTPFYLHVISFIVALVVPTCCGMFKFMIAIQNCFLSSIVMYYFIKIIYSLSISINIRIF